MIVFLNDRFIPEEKAVIAPTDRGFTLADGVFDTLLAVDGIAQYSREHFERLFRHAAVLRLKSPLTAMELEKVAAQLLHENNFSQGRYALRTTLTRGIGARGLALPENSVPTLLMRAVSASASVPAQAIIAQTTRRNEQSPLSRIKALQYGDNLLALLEAQDQGCNEALLLNTAGKIACATAGNVFILEQGQLFTPPPVDGALDGITRARLIRAGAREQSLTPERVAGASAIYVTNSISGIRPVEKLDGKTIGSDAGIYRLLAA